MIMPCRDRVSRLAGAGAVAFAVALGTGPAAAHPAPFTVTAGSAATGASVAFKATSQGTSPQVRFTDTTTGSNLPTCASASLYGAVRTGTAASGLQLATVDGAQAVFSGCAGIFGQPFRFRGYGTWRLNVSDAVSGVAIATITDFRGNFTATTGPTCTFDVGSDTGSFTSSGTASISPGTLATKYTNSSQLLDVRASNPGALGLWNVNPNATAHNCLAGSVLAQGDAMSLSVTLTSTALNSAYNPVAIN